MLVTDIYNRDYAYLKKLGNSYKLIKCNEVRRKGFSAVDVKKEKDTYRRCNGYRFEVFEFEKEVADFSSDYVDSSGFKEHTVEEKLSNNICRARNKILEYVLCNDFVFFVTLTLDPDKYDRENLKQFNHDLSAFIRNYNQRKNANIKYLFIPERHVDGCWHMHGFIMGLPYDRLELFDLHGERPLPPYIVKKLRNNELLYSFPEYEKRFGYNIFEPIRNKKASVLYMSKYLTKDLSRNVTELGCHLYYCSKGLKKAEIIKEGQFLDSSYQFDFSNEYGGQSFFDILSDTELEEIKGKIGGEPVHLEDYKKGYRKDGEWYEFVDRDTGEIFGRIPEDVKEMLL
ncbi:MAG: hypothetical protein K2K56_03140 [Lachnospiraceae bacterium]|nr:hypothetical protein [Lachnospiraceae bacterium]